MASRRINYARGRSPEQSGDAVEYAAFLADVLAGKVTASKLIETRAGGKVALSYDDPTGIGQTLVAQPDES